MAVWRRMGMTLMTAIALTGAYRVYSVVIAPSLRVAVRAVQPASVASMSDPNRPEEYVRVAGQWLKDQPWTSKAGKLLRTDEMFLYANEWMPHGEQGHILFRPFAAVWLSKDKQGVEQAIRVCAESALL